MKKFYNGKYDIVFKAVFCDENNPLLLKTFLEKLLHISIQEIVFLKQELQPNDVKERKKIVDLLVKVDNHYLHIELNPMNKIYLHIRNFCYFANIISKNTRKVKEYDLATQFIHIDISYGIKGREAKEEYYLMNKDNHLYIENVKIIEYNMDRIMEYWYTSDKEKIEEYKYLIMLDLDRESLGKLAKGDRFMEAYQKKVETLNDSDIYTPWITPEEDAEMILNTEKHISYNEGVEQGIEQGIEQGKNDRNIEIAKSLLKMDIGIEIIAETTGLSLERLSQLQQES